MKAIFDGKEYAVTLGRNQLAEGVKELCPMALAMTRSGSHEYYGTLPGRVDTQTAEQTSAVKAGGVYYFEDWNVLALVFRDTDIRPYSVHVVGRVENAFARELSQAGNHISILFREESK